MISVQSFQKKLIQNLWFQPRIYSSIPWFGVSTFSMISKEWKCSSHLHSYLSFLCYKYIMVEVVLHELACKLRPPHVISVGKMNVDSPLLNRIYTLSELRSNWARKSEQKSCMAHGDCLSWQSPRYWPTFGSENPVSPNGTMK